MGMFDFMTGKPSTSTQTLATWESPQWSFTEPRMKLQSDFISGNLDSMNQGNFMGYYQNAMPKIRAEMQRANRESVYGTPGYRNEGMMGQAAEEGAMYGLGPKSTVARKRKATNIWQEKNNAIEAYLQQMGVNTTTQNIGTLLGASNQMEQGPKAMPQLLSSTTGGTKGLMEDIGSAMPWMDLAKTGMGWLGKFGKGGSIGGEGMGMTGQGWSGDIGSDLGYGTGQSSDWTNQVNPSSYQGQWGPQNTSGSYGVSGYW